MTAKQHEPGETLLTAEIRALLPPLYSQEDIADPLVPVHFFLGGWDWYPTEFDGDDLFFGLVAGPELELGYFTLSELVRVTRNGLRVERDEHWTPTPLSTLRLKHQR